MDSLNVLPFELSAHYELLIDLHKSQKYDQIATFTRETLPKTGFLVFKDDICVSAGFLRLVEGGFGQIDTMVSNAASPGEVRHEALNILVNCLISKAKDLKLHGLVAFTTSNSILTRAEVAGFRALTHSVIALPL